MAFKATNLSRELPGNVLKREIDIGPKVIALMLNVMLFELLDYCQLP